MLNQFGWSDALQQQFMPYAAAGLIPARVVVQQRGLYGIATEAGEWSATLTGRLAYEAEEGAYPVAGDWVAVEARPNERTATIHHVLPRSSSFVRRASGPGAARAQVVAANVDVALLAQWAKGDVARTQRSEEVPGGSFRTRPGVFAWDRVDAASKMLAQALPGDLRGPVADFGAGWGYLSLQLLARCPRVTSLDLYEADARALALADENLAAMPDKGGRIPVHCHWHDVAQGVSERFDAIVCNPPFHALGRGERPDIGRAFIASAADALKPGGRLWLVANRHLPYEQALGEGFAQMRTVAQQGGFKIVEATKAAR